jgi:hypothetical protein
VLHREDGPAVTESRGTLAWYRDGEPHRDDGPAMIVPGSGERWCFHGELHRGDGPAVIDYTDGSEYWWIYGKMVCNDLPDDGLAWFA